MFAETLARIVLRHPDVLKDERTCRALLEDLLQADPVRRGALWTAHVNGAVAKLRQLGAGLRDAAVLRRLGLELEAISGLKQEHALWAVLTWARALELARHGGAGGPGARRPKNWVVAPFAARSTLQPRGADGASEAPPPVDLGAGPFGNPFVEPAAEAADHAAQHLGFLRRAIEECLWGTGGINPYRLERLVDLQRRLEVTREEAAEVFAAVADSPKPRRGRRGADLVVSRTGRGDYSTIGEALANAPDGARIWVRPGLYEESLYLDRQVELIAEGARGDVRVLANGEPCLRMETGLARVCGFTLENMGPESYAAVWAPAGQLVLDDCAVTSACGHGLAVVGPESRVDALHCVFTGSLYAGAHVSNHARPTFTDCVFQLNGGDGVRVERQAQPRLVGCLLLQNRDAGALVGNGGRGEFLRCRFLQHEYDGLRLEAGGDATLTGCVFQTNRRCGAYAKAGAQGALVGCRFIRNGATQAADTIVMKDATLSIFPSGGQS